MRAPISWLKEFVDITPNHKELADRLTEVGLGVEKIERVDGDVIFEFEVTPNRPDLLSIVGIAREIAAIEGKKVRERAYELKPPQKKSLPMKLHPNYELFLRWSAVLLANVVVKPSPAWMQERLEKVGFRPINNIVDVTNYVMIELGMPLHAFDYDQIKGVQMAVDQAKGGERFTTVDELTYSLPKGAIIIRDSERIIDLAGIKGGLNSGIRDTTKNVFLQATVDNPVLIRRASQALSLRSEASAIYERGPDKGGVLNTLSRAASLILEFTGGELASPPIDLKKENFKPWTIDLAHQRLVRMLGIDIDPKQAKTILEQLGLKTTMNRELSTINYSVTVPTYRNDLHIEEDLIEEVARLYGYNNFPKKIPQGPTPTVQVPYLRNYQSEEVAKQLLQACGFSEISTYSLVNEGDLLMANVNPQHTLRIDNPVSRDYEYLRPTLKTNLIKALRENRPNSVSINLFELGKVYQGKTVDTRKEYDALSAITNKKSFYEVKGVLERLYRELGVDDDPSAAIEVLDEGVFFELNFSQVTKQAHREKVFTPIPKYPPILEDLALLVDKKIKTGKIIEEIQRQSKLISQVSLLDQYESTRTFHIVYQHRDRNLTTDEIADIRTKILIALGEKFAARLKK